MLSPRDIVNSGLLEKYDYDLYGIYADYPHKSFWSQTAGDAGYRKALIETFGGRRKIPLLFYVHIPFCPRLCHFCSCHTRATGNYRQVREYLDLLYREIDMLGHFLGEHGLEPDVREIHLGGGSPTMLRRDDFENLLARLGSIADRSGLSELAMEIDPRHVTLEKLLYYRSQGINRISFGVQDLDPAVQAAVGRIQPPELLDRLLTPEVRALFTSINFDIMWGLPRQTVDSFRATMEKVLAFSPDRISMLLLHYAPQVKQNQLHMNPAEFPGHRERTVLFLEAVRMLTDHGYTRIGFDHFAKPGDAVSVALRERKLCWNSLGYTPGRYQDIIGIGTGSSSRVSERYYFQNVYDQEQYRKLLDDGAFPLLRSHALDRDSILRREVLHTLRSYFSLDIGAIEKRYGIVFREYFADELAELQPFEADGLVATDGDLTITEKGMLFTTLICRTFDRFAKIELARHRAA
jgi:oxygen-independent coproporphyrinogen-3 oxidase